MIKEEKILLWIICLSGVGLILMIKFYPSIVNVSGGKSVDPLTLKEQVFIGIPAMVLYGLFLIKLLIQGIKKIIK